VYQGERTNEFVDGVRFYPGLLGRGSRRQRTHIGRAAAAISPSALAVTNKRSNVAPKYVGYWLVAHPMTVHPGPSQHDSQLSLLVGLYKFQSDWGHNRHPPQGRFRSQFLIFLQCFGCVRFVRGAHPFSTLLDSITRSACRRFVSTPSLPPVWSLVGLTPKQQRANNPQHGGRNDDRFFHGR
jgi:hypothetical protein